MTLLILITQPRLGSVVVERSPGMREVDTGEVGGLDPRPSQTKRS